MKGRLVLGAIAVALVLAIGTVAAGGFDDAGYNRKARVFVGTGWSWCMDKIGDEAWCTAYLGPYADDMLLMKWNSEWDRGNEEGWSNPPYRAWLSNEWNGMVPGGSGETWHYMYKWIGLPCDDTNPNWEEGGYCIWGQFEVIMSHGTYDGGHLWDAHATPAGYGA
ncbi:MAG: hypothetical protein GTN38_04175 [Candidatus Aenigmarchaeota archaeon]|nr:hypothetical protein [Candidatus Aenigmarchaeota archaeon]NIP40858.1 hypothetical protein [Candidatus Aenigmarchaeota archaeon]NIQ17972.1 hypothetical protein [Candidatus Aenigmarchaeota archaeon]NIS73561.1 hypothetical protein [Candidatus Aenigmarchaeota archaeon]